MTGVSKALASLKARIDGRSAAEVAEAAEHAAALEETVARCGDEAASIQQTVKPKRRRKRRARTYFKRPMSFEPRGQQANEGGREVPQMDMFEDSADRGGDQWSRTT